MPRTTRSMDKEEVGKVKEEETVKLSPWVIAKGKRVVKTEEGVEEMDAVKRRKKGGEEREMEKGKMEGLESESESETKVSDATQTKEEKIAEEEEHDEEEEDTGARSSSEFPVDNEYERKRQQNILKNKLLLQQLQLDNSTLFGISKGKPSKPKPTQSSSRSSARRKHESSAEFVPRRTSSRLAGLPADSEAARNKYAEQSAVLEEVARQRWARVGGDVTFDVGGGFDFAVKGERYARTFTDEDVAQTGDEDVKRARERMMGLKLFDRWQPNDIKVTPERIYYLAFHPTPNKPLIFAGDKLGTLGIWDTSTSKPDPDASSEEGESSLPAITTFKIHPRTISAFNFSPFSPNTVFTASYDGSIRSLDFSKGLSTELFVSEDEEGISGVEMHEDNPYLIYFSTLTGGVGRKDTRVPKRAEVWALSDKKIGGFSIHPIQTHLCSTASLDRTLKIWDLRNIGGGAGIFGTGEDRKPALIGEHISIKSESCAYWNRSNSIATTSYDDTVKIYKFPGCAAWSPGEPIPTQECQGGNKPGVVEPSTVIKHNNQTGRWVTILRAQWQQNPRQGGEKLVIANMNRFLDIYAEDGTQLAQLGDDLLTAVPAAAMLHPTEDWVAGGTASGKVALFM